MASEPVSMGDAELLRLAFANDELEAYDRRWIAFWRGEVIAYDERLLTLSRSLARDYDLPEAGPILAYVQLGYRA